MKILYSALTEYFWMHIMEVVNNMAELGHEVHVAGFLRSRPKRLHPLATFHNITLRNRGLREAMDPDFWRALIRYGRGDKPDGKRDSFYKSWLSHLIESGSFDLVYERRSDFNPGIVLAKRYGIPSILEVNGLQALEFGWKGYKYEEVKQVLDNELRAIKYATKIICVAQGIRDYFVGHGCDSDKFEIIPNGVNIDIFYPMDKRQCRQRLGLRHDDRIIGFSGSLQFFYEIDCAIKSMPAILKQVPNAHLVIIGREYLPPLGPGRRFFRDLANNLTIGDRVTFLEAVPYEEVPYYINSFDVCLLPIVKRDGWHAGISPLKLREYMACGQPVVASNVSGDAQIIRESEAGLLYEPSNPEDIADKVCMILKDPQLASQMGENARQNVLKNGTWRGITEKILLVAEKAINKITQQQESEKCY